MTYWNARMRRLVQTTAFVSCWTVLTSTCTAGPILDWLFPGMAARRAQRELYWSQPGTTTYSVPVSAYYGGYPQWSAGNPYQSFYSGYAPSSNFRTVWSPVPVTSFRPVTYVNPLATGSTTSVQPCTTYSWQARRVPYVSYSPTISQYGSYPTTYSGYAPYTTAPTTSVQSYYAPTANYGVTTFYGSTAPNYDTDSETATPWVPVDSTATMSEGYPTGAVFSPTCPTDSSVAPAQYLDSSGMTAPATTYQELPSTVAPSTTTPFSSGEPTLAPVPPADQPPQLPSGSANPGVIYQRPTLDLGSTPQAPIRPAQATPQRSTPVQDFERVRPIPEMAPAFEPRTIPTSPRLRDRDSHTADNQVDRIPAYNSNWRTVQINWSAITSEQPTQTTQVRRIPAATREVSAPILTAPKWDDSGWRTAK
ncbi:MAG: hypothetical protein KDA60_01345 [Planctomycetales bacterium]|nr:hypothetical protein [Planctomycetales bacterium]